MLSLTPPTYAHLWSKLLKLIPERDLRPLISAMVKMKQNETLLTPQELEAYAQWFTYFEASASKNPQDSLAESGFELLASAEQKMNSHRTMLTPGEIEAYQHWYLSCLAPYAAQIF